MSSLESLISDAGSSGRGKRNSSKIENILMKVRKQDTLTFLVYAFVCIWNTRRLVHTIATYER